MMGGLLTIDPNWLVHSIIVYPKIGEDDYNAPIYGDPVTYDQVRMDLTKKYVWESGKKQLAANATVFLFAQYTNNFPVDIDDKWLHAKVTFNGHDYLVSNWSLLCQPESAAPFSIELELI